MKRITITDIAKMLSINPSTVSRALADHKDVNKETKARVKECAEQFNYIPNLHARYFRKKNSQQIALILPEVNMFFTPSMLNGLYEAAEKKGLSVVVFYSSNKLSSEKEAIKSCLSWAVDGVIIICSVETINGDHLDELANASIPVVMLDKVTATKACHSVSIDDENAAKKACEILINKGCKSILALLAKEKLLMSKNRKNGAIQACARSGITLHTLHIEDVLTIAEQLSSIDLSTYDGIFAMSDEILFYLKDAITRNNSNSKILISAISDGVLPTKMGKDLPYVLHSGYNMGVEAVNTLVDIISDKQNLIKDVKVEVIEVF